MFQKARNYILSSVATGQGDSPDTAVILGSGLGAFVDSVTTVDEISYGDIPGFPVSTVSGHAGTLIRARHSETGKLFWIMRGRVHYYEGYSMEEVVFPVRVLAALGVRRLIITNAAGGVNPKFDAGDLMLITDHINLFGHNPLIGKNRDELGPRFPDMTEAYDTQMRKVVSETAGLQGLSLRRGVYLGWSGPTFETPAEVGMIRTLGADVVGMSTVPEVIVARHAGLRVCGITFVSNKAAGLSETPLTHEEVAENASQMEKPFAELLLGTLRGLTS